MLVAEFVEAEITDWLKEYKDEHSEPLTTPEIKFLAMLAKHIIKSYELYKQSVK